MPATSGLVIVALRKTYDELPTSLFFSPTIYVAAGTALGFASTGLDAGRPSKAGLMVGNVEETDPLPGDLAKVREAAGRLLALVTEEE